MKNEPQYHEYVHCFCKSIHNKNCLNSKEHYLQIEFKKEFIGFNE